MPGKQGMDYPTALDWLYGAQTFGIKLGLEHPRRLLEALGRPQDRLRFVHIAGTNGKGSVCAFLASILQAAGQRTGRFTSPHLVDFRERMTLQGEMISPEAVAEGLTRLQRLVQNWPEPPTFFELTTALAMEWFARQGAEWVVLETGMGGRLDATNVVLPELCLLTPVSFDHQAWLGDTLAAIAGEKAGILKPGVPAISLPQPPEAREVFARRAEEVGAPLEWISEPWGATELPLAGEHQAWNAALAVAAARKIIPGIADEIVWRGLAATRWPARFQRWDEQIVVDGAHNEEAVEILLRTWRQTFGKERPVVLFGAVRDKPHAEMLRRLGEIAAEFWLVPLRSPRGVRPEEFQLPDGVPARVFPEVLAAIQAGRKQSGKLLVCGSLFLAGEALGYLQAEEAPRPSMQ